MPATIVAVSRSDSHSFSKQSQSSIRLIAGLGVQDDAHQGVTVKHLSRVARDPSQPNLRQVHLIHSELHNELAAAGFEVHPGELGENVTTQGIRLLELPAGTRLRLGASAVVEVTGLRNPCVQIDRFRPGLLGEVVGRDDSGATWRKTGIMSVVITGGDVKPGDAIAVDLPPEPHRPLEVV
ncbi:MAG TPA: MOSC domain-containing protein [Gemmatimonadaceae bacterium]|jgi:MOSC domain-containing protein YiiM|nr:MOSC domain-containing protein [Gemmatimonadaceae bacterium]